MADKGAAKLIEALRLTREALEVLLADLEAIKLKRAWTVSEERDHRSARRALRKLTNEYLPWARIGNLSSARSAEIAFWLNGIWSALPLDEG